jgi:hypothetical protein
MYKLDASARDLLYFRDFLRSFHASAVSKLPYFLLRLPTAQMRSGPQSGCCPHFAGLEGLESHFVLSLKRSKAVGEDHLAAFDFLTAVTANSTIFPYVTPYGLLEVI